LKFIKLFVFKSFLILLFEKKPLDNITQPKTQSPMISQDTHFIEDLKDITKTVKPEEVN